MHVQEKALHTLRGRDKKESATPSDVSFETREGDEDPLHCLIKSEPRIFPLAMVRKVKQEATIQLWQVHERELRRHFWKERALHSRQRKSGYKTPVQ